MFVIGKPLFNILFNIIGSYLHTEIGTIILEASASLSSLSNKTSNVTNPQNPQYQGLTLSSDSKWITYNSKNWVWLPSKYWTSCSAILGKTIGIGVGTGKV